MSETLKPCPFCGAEARYRPDHYIIVEAHDKPDCECPLAGEVTVACDPVKWNRRATPGTQESALREALERIVREWDEEGKRIKRALYPSSWEAWEEAADYRRSQLHTILNVHPPALPPSTAQAPGDGLVIQRVEAAAKEHEAQFPETAKMLRGLIDGSTVPEPPPRSCMDAREGRLRQAIINAVGYERYRAIVDIFDADERMPPAPTEAGRE